MAEPKPEVDIAVQVLAADMRARIPELKEVNVHWPDPKEQLNMPCVTILTTNMPFLPCNPRLLSKTDDPANAQNLLTRYLLGNYDGRISLDLWADYPNARAKAYQAVMDYFDRQFLQGEREMPGLSLQLSDYFSDAFACYTVVGYTFPEQEESSQRSEWRARIDVLVNYPRIKEKSEPKITQIVIKSEVGDQVEPDETNEDVQEDDEL